MRPATSGFSKLGRDAHREVMAPHVTHIGVHDHGFNNVSTYGNLWRLMHEGRIPHNQWELRFLRAGAQASAARCRRARLDAASSDGIGYIYSFNGPQSLFVDTIRSLRSLALAHQLGHTLMGESDQPISLLERLVEHARATARYNICYGEGRDAYDVPGRVAHESIFNTNNGDYRCPSTQQGYSPFSTWTRGLAWAMLGYAEQLELLDDAFRRRARQRSAAATEIEAMFRCAAASATCDFYIDAHAAPTASRTGTPALPAWPDGRLPRPAGGSVQRPRAGRQLGRRDRLPGPAAARALPGATRRGRRRYGGGQRYVEAGLTVLQNAARRAVPVDRSAAPGPAAALGLPPAERLGPRPGRPQGPVRRIQHVGRLPPPRSGPVRRPAGRTRRTTRSSDPSRNRSY